MDDQYTEAFGRVLEEARKITGISEDERSLLYEEFKARVYELMHDGRTEPGRVVDEALSWLRGRVQLRQSFKRLEGKQ